MSIVKTIAGTYLFKLLHESIEKLEGVDDEINHKDLIKQVRLKKILETMNVPRKALHEIPEGWREGTFHITCAMQIPNIHNVYNNNKDRAPYEHAPMDLWTSALKEIVKGYFLNMFEGTEDYPLIICPGTALSGYAGWFAHCMDTHVAKPLRNEGVEVAVHWYYGSASHSSVETVLVAFGMPGLYSLAGF